MYSHFISLLNTKMAWVVEICMYPIPLLLMTWRLKVPANQQQWYWPAVPEHSEQFLARTDDFCTGNTASLWWWMTYLISKGKPQTFHFFHRLHKCGNLSRNYMRASVCTMDEARFKTAQPTWIFLTYMLMHCITASLGNSKFCVEKFCVERYAKITYERQPNFLHA